MKSTSKINPTTTKRGQLAGQSKHAPNYRSVKSDMLKQFAPVVSTTLCVISSKE